jgi:4-hydroxy-3-polyprenylbenzoate decarboxylase
VIPSFSSLRSFLDHCHLHGELAVIDRPVDRHLEVCEIADRVMHQSGGGKALLFTNVKGSRFPVAVNILGSERRMAWALGSENLRDAEDRIAKLVEIEPPRNFREGLEIVKSLAGVRHAFPKTVKRAPVQETVQPSVDLSQIPVLTTWPDDAGPFITFPMVFSKSPDGKSNCGMYRMQVFDRTTTGMHWQRQKDGRRHLDEAARRIPVAVAIGGPPVLTWAATAPLPPDVFEMLLAGFLQRRRVPMVKCGIHDILVPAEADFVLEGWVDPDDLRLEGPFGDHTGYYSQEGMYPAFHVERVTHRRDAIYPATVVGVPPKEDNWMGLATERLFLPLLRRVHGEIRDLRLPPEGVFHNLVVAAVRKRYPGHAHKTFHAVWGTGQMMFTKMVLAVDQGADLSDTKGLLEAIDRNWHATRDTSLSKGPADTLDHADACDFGGKIGIDATSRLAGEDSLPRSSADQPISWDFDISRHPGVVRASVPEGSDGRVLLVQIAKSAAGQGLSFLKSLKRQDLSSRILAVAVFDDREALESGGMALVVGGANLDPARDVVVLDSPRPGKALGFDCTKKRADEGYDRGAWPGIIRQDPSVVGRVDGYWKELGL